MAALVSVNKEKAMFGLSADQITGQLRQLLPILGSMAVALGWISPEKANTLISNILAVIGPLMILGGIVWTAIANTQKAIAQSAAAIPGTVVVTTPELAKSTPEGNIVSNEMQKDSLAATVSNAKVNQ